MVETGVTGRGLVTLSSALIVVKPLICRDRDREILVTQPQATQFCLAVKRLNCTFAFLPPSCLVLLVESDAQK